LGATVWQMIPNSSAQQTKSAGTGFVVKMESNVTNVAVIDGDGQRYQIRSSLAPDGEISVMKIGLGERE
jgi:hypothetical protein